MIVQSTDLNYPEGKGGNAPLLGDPTQVAVSRHETRRAQLLEAAIGLFGEVGFERATIKSLARKAGISQGLIYHYFKNKEELISAVMESTSLIPAMRELYGQAETLPLEEGLFTVCQNMFLLFWKNKETIWLFFRELRTNPQVASSMELTGNENVRLMVEYLESRILHGELRPHNAWVTAHTLISSIFLIHLHYERAQCGGRQAARKLPGNCEELGLFIRDQVDIVLHGIRSK